MGTYVTQGTYTWSAVAVNNVRTPVGFLENDLVTVPAAGTGFQVNELRPLNLEVYVDNVSSQDMYVASLADFNPGSSYTGGVTPVYVIKAGSKQTLSFTVLPTSPIGSDPWTGDLYLAPTDWRDTSNTSALSFTYLIFVS
jgi:hypothetical protein